MSTRRSPIGARLTRATIASAESFLGRSTSRAQRVQTVNRPSRLRTTRDPRSWQASQRAPVGRGRLTCGRSGSAKDSSSTDSALMQDTVQLGDRSEHQPVQLGMIGLGRMGANMVRRLMRDHHTCVVYDHNPAAVQNLAKEGALGSDSLDRFVAQLTPPRTVWLMVPAAVVDPTLKELASRLQSGDAIVDGGNSYYVDDLRRSAGLESSGIAYMDVGTSGGIWGLERGYCLMIGGPAPAVQRLEPIFRTLAPGLSSEYVPRTPGRTGEPASVELGYLHCGPSGAGHFVKMVHNAIEYGLMEAYAEGLNILHHADIGTRQRVDDAETTPLQHPENYQYELDLPAISEVWRRGSVVSSWLLDLIAAAMQTDPRLSKFTGHVSDSGEGRWTVTAAIDEGAPAPVLSAALFQRFSSRGEALFAEKLLSAMRYEFGGHVERPAGG
jgi:6-phosphogluconate dehydrogenase